MAVQFGLKKLGAISTALVLLYILVACPILTCPLMADSDTTHSCCPHSESHPASHSSNHSRTSVQDCPYLLLEKTKNPRVTAYAPAQIATPIWVSAAAAPAFADESYTRIADSSRIFLRIHVLLI
jgi:hypothetical protein